MAGIAYKRTFGPLALTNTLTTNVYNNTSALIFDIIRHIHIVNKTGGAVTFSLWLGATGANLVVTAGTTLYVRNSDGSVTFQPLTAPPVLDITNAGDGKKATFTFVIAR